MTRYNIKIALKFPGIHIYGPKDKAGKKRTTIKRGSYYYEYDPKNKAMVFTIPDCFDDPKNTNQSIFNIFYRMIGMAHMNKDRGNEYLVKSVICTWFAKYNESVDKCGSISRLLNEKTYYNTGKSTIDYIRLRHECFDTSYISPSKSCAFACYIEEVTNNGESLGGNQET